MRNTRGAMSSINAIESLAGSVYTLSFYALQQPMWCRVIYDIFRSTIFFFSLFYFVTLYPLRFDRRFRRRQMKRQKYQSATVLIHDAQWMRTPKMRCLQKAGVFRTVNVVNFFQR